MGRVARPIWVRIHTQEAVANDAAPAPRGIGINRRVSLHIAYITAYEDKFVYYSLERFKNGGMVQQQLQALKLQNSKFSSRLRKRKVAWGNFIPPLLRKGPLRRL